MKAAQFKSAVKLALSDAELDCSIECFDGFALDSFGKVYCTIEQVARLIRWQAVMFNGDIDNDALAEVAEHGRRKFIIVG